MDCATLKTRIKNKELSGFYVFTGPEYVVQWRYIRMMADAVGLPIVYMESFRDVYPKLKNVFRINRNSVYVIRDDKDLMQNEGVWGQIDGGILGKNLLILLVTELDKRTKFYKRFKESVCEFERLPDAVLARYVQKDTGLSKSASEALISACEADYGRALLEADKVKRYSDATSVTDTEATTRLLDDGTIHRPPEDAIFRLVDAIIDKQNSLSFELFEECKGVGESPLVILSVLYNNAKAVLQVKTCSSNDIARSTGLSSWQVQNAKKHVSRRTTAELEDILRLVRKCERGVKLGLIEESVVIDYILVSIL